MQSWQPSMLSWSFTRKARFETCRRRYFYDRFWGQDPKLKWKLYEMRNITSLSKLRGQAVHAVISGALRGIRLGVEVDLELAKQSITEILRAKYMESQKKLWRIDNRPRDRKLSEIANLLEHYYRFPNVGESAREARAVAWTCIENLWSSDLWREIGDSRPRDWKEIDEDGFPRFDIDGIQVFAKIDFAYEGDCPTIIDWKTGQPNDGDRKQLALYSLYAAAKWNWNPIDTRLVAAHLYPELQIDTFSPTSEELEEVRQDVNRSFAEMLDLEPALGPADISKFPMREHDQICHWCRFRGMCLTDAPDPEK